MAVQDDCEDDCEDDDCVEEGVEWLALFDGLSSFSVSFSNAFSRFWTFSNSVFTLVRSPNLVSMAFSMSVSALSKLSARHLAALKMSVMRLVLTEQSFSLPEGGGPISSTKSYIWY